MESMKFKIIIDNNEKVFNNINLINTLASEESNTNYSLTKLVSE